MATYLNADKEQGKVTRRLSAQLLLLGEDVTGESDEVGGGSFKVGHVGLCLMEWVIARV